MERTITVDTVRTFETRSGSTRFVVRDTEGNDIREAPEDDTQN